MIAGDWFGVGPEKRPSVLMIAEIGVNHNGDLPTALRMINAAADSGADAVKIQAFCPEQMILRGTAKVDYQKVAGESGEDQYALLERLKLNPSQIKTLMERAAAKQIHFIASVFDLESAELLRNLGVAILKIPSGELTNLPLIRKVAGYGRPLLLSTGMATLGETEAALAAAQEGGAAPLALLHCVSSYPAPYESLNLKAIRTLQTVFRLPVGYSDHALGWEATIAAVALGAVMIEKHFTLDRNLPGPDQRASLTPDEFRQVVAGVRKTEAALGNGVKTLTGVERETRRLTRKSVVARVDIAKGTSITIAMLTTKRPGTGISPLLIEEIIGCRAVRNIPRDTMLQWNDLSAAAKEETADV